MRWEYDDLFRKNLLAQRGMKRAICYHINFAVDFCFEREFQSDEIEKTFLSFELDEQIKIARTRAIARRS